MPSSTVKDHRLALRLSRAQRLLIEQAARERGETLTEFSVSAAVSRAEEALAGRTAWALDDQAWAGFTAALDHPARVLPGLAELAAAPPVFE
ncbi:MAG: DUF1778 domain-containing protein [Bifidobacteriaceae bacterium]|jgi:uncharacterized protein (DUF1778 family)|nr:DUF1778 domain-containing protein [Bifidobacteriaceae bacterium]